MKERKESQQTVRESYKFSKALADALIEASANLPAGRNTVDSIDVIIAVINEGERGYDFLRSFMSDEDLKNLKQNLLSHALLSSNDSHNVSANIGSKSIRVSMPLYKLLNAANERAAGGKIVSDDIIALDIESGSSILRKAFTESGFVEIYPGEAEVYSRAIKYTEKGETILTVDVSKAIEVPEAKESKVVKVEKVEGRAAKALELQKKEQVKKINSEIVRPKWVSDLIDSVENHPVTVIVSDSQDDAESVISSYSRILAEGNNHNLKYRKFEQVSGLSALSDSGFGDFLNDNKEGSVIYIPFIEDYRDNALLRNVLRSETIRVVTQMSHGKFVSLSEKDRLIRSANRITLEPPTLSDAEKIITSKKAELEERLSLPNLKIKIKNEAIKEAIRVSDRYYKSLNILTAARALILRAATNIKIEKSGLKINKDLGVAKDSVIDKKDIQIALFQLTGIEISDEGNKEKYLQLESRLKEKIVGQDKAVEAVSEVILKARAGLKNPGKPIGSFIFMGPSGVGKTELAKSLAEELFGSESALIRLDMSEYQEQHNVARLIGSPPGYIGYEEGGQLTKAIDKRPYSIILLDEIEKAHPKVADVLLQVLDDGRLTDGQGKVHDFKNAVIIMTGNVGSEFYRLEQKVGRAKVIAAVREKIRDPKVFKTEFLNRVDGVIVFNSLNKKVLSQIAELQIPKINKYLADKNINVSITTDARDFLVNKTYAPEYGARPLVKEIIEAISQKISRQILEGKIVKGDKVRIDIKNRKISLKVSKKRKR